MFMFLPNQTANSPGDKPMKSAEKKQAFAADKPEIWAWIMRNQSFAFAVAMREAVEKYGDLTDNQEAACVRCMVREADRNQQIENNRLARNDAAKPIDTTGIEKAFASARTNGDKGNLKLRFAGFIVKPAKSNSVNVGALYVQTAEDRVYLGKIVDGRFFQSRECDAVIEQKFRTVCDDPKGAAIAYGHLTGSCACCGRTLTNNESISLGIGPICAEKFGW